MLRCRPRAKPKRRIRVRFASFRRRRGFSCSDAFASLCFFFSSRRRHTRLVSDWSSDVCSSDLYAVNFGGGQVDITNGKFVFSASEAYMIEDGHITAPIKGATLIGNGPDVLTRVRSEERRVGKECRSRWSPYH